jgi:hypothetical protein
MFDATHDFNRFHDAELEAAEREIVRQETADAAEYQTDSTIGKVVASLKRERARQREKWGEQSHPQLHWLGILMEELGEYAQTLIEEQDIITEDQDIERVESELIHVAATAIAALESLENHGIEGRDSNEAGMV